MSPASDMPSMPLMGRHHSDLGPFFPPGSLPPHLRTDFGSAHSHSPRSGSVSPSLSSYGGSLGGHPHPHPGPGGQRPSLTSHPQMYSSGSGASTSGTNLSAGAGGGAGCGGHLPPPTLEPPPHHHHAHLAHAGEPRSATGSVSGGGSPHLSSVGWQSPVAASMGSPVPSAADGYMYPEPAFGLPAGHLYYPSSHLRRPNSAEPGEHAFEAKRGLVAGVQGEVWSGHM